MSVTPQSRWPPAQHGLEIVDQHQRTPHTGNPMAGGSDRTKYRKRKCRRCADIDLHTTSSRSSQSASRLLAVLVLSDNSNIRTSIPSTPIMRAVSADADGTVRTLAFEDYAPCVVVQPLITGTDTDTGTGTDTGTAGNTAGTRGSTSNSLQLKTRITTSFPQSYGSPETVAAQRPCMQRKFRTYVRRRHREGGSHRVYKAGG